MTVKSDIRRVVWQARARALRTLFAFGPEAFARALGEVGVAPGGRLMVHSSLDAFEGFTGKPSDVLEALQVAVTASGLVAMPTLPFSGTAAAWADGDPLFDPQRTPSRTGLLTELFRRLPGVERSLHPTHPVAARGRNAREFLAGHERAATPCGRGSPYVRLIEEGGQVLLLGVGIEVLTLYHAVEELLEAELPESPFTTRTWRLRSRGPDGAIVVTETRLFDPGLSRRRNLGKLVPELVDLGAWREVRVGRLSLTLIEAPAVLAAVGNLARRGVYCYD